MSGFLFVSLPLTGHVNGMAAIARALADRGHKIAWAGSARVLRPLVGPQAHIHPIPLRMHRAGITELGMTEVKARWEGYVVQHARATLRGVDAAAAEMQPDLLVADQLALAGALVAHRRGLPWATVATGSMELTRPFRALPKVESWILGLLDELWTGAGLPGRPPHDLRFSPHLLIALTSEALAGAGQPGAVTAGEPLWPGNAALVGPALGPRTADADFPWDWLDPGRRHVLITVGSMWMDLAEDFYRRMAQALAPLGDRIQAIVVAPEYAVPDPPAHMLVLRGVPMLDLMPHLDAVVCHAGQNTVCEALAHGLPLVVAPIKTDQPVVAGQVAAAGAGVRVSFVRSPPPALRDAVLAVLDDPSYRAAAERMRALFRKAGGAARAADLLESLAARGGLPHGAAAGAAGIGPAAAVATSTTT
jgi:UDP:flavonoid glycosyltransferase YjiC (YdhE family)